MKRFKEIDYWISVLLSCLCGIITVVTLSFEWLTRSYCIIGGWQVISMLVHTLKGWFMKKGGARSNYHWITFCILATVMLGIMMPPLLLIIFFTLLAGSPFLIAIYTKICFDEVKALKLTHSLNLR